jgi:hypothetical protein
MPRNHNAGISTLRNRNRVTNKTRLKIFHGSIDDDSLVYEETPSIGLFADAQGVDAEDANVRFFPLPRFSRRLVGVARCDWLVAVGT